MQFTDIAAYPSHKFRSYWLRVLRDPQFLAVIKNLGSKLRHEKEEGNSFGNWIAGMKKMLASLGSWVDFRAMLQKAVSFLVQRTTKGLTWSGTDQAFLKTHDRGVCFLSNHRSTSLDSVFFNYALYEVFKRTSYSAAGDNIFETSWLGHLIRMNQGFVVKRTVEDPDEKIREAERLSTYINDLLKQREWVWIAHRNGRSKDGKDNTDSAVPAMLKLSEADLDWNEYTEANTIVPVAVSWELVPLDLQLSEEATGTTHNAGHGRDMKNILVEITQNKGRVHVALAAPVRSAKRAALVKHIDAGIHGNLRLWESNILAYLLTATPDASTQALIETEWEPAKGAWVIDRGSDLNVEAREHFLEMYAAPVHNALAAAGSWEALISSHRRFA